jgi:phage FluMu protein Com
MKNPLGEMYGREEGQEHEDMECPNCKQIISAAQVMTHTVECYRGSTKCRICDEVIQKNNKKGHLDKWRSSEVSSRNAPHPAHPYIQTEAPDRNS